MKDLEKNRSNTKCVITTMSPVVILGESFDFSSLNFLYFEINEKLVKKLLYSVLRIDDNVGTHTCLVYG